MIRKLLYHNPFPLSLTFLLLILSISALLLNRAFTIGAISGIVFLLFAYKKIGQSKKTVLLSVLFLVVAITILAVYVKSDSTLGRILIYKISWRMFLEHPITGIGWGNFQRDYGLYQAEYFRMGTFTQKEFLLAGNTFYAFNDYWEFVVETGAIGAIFLMASIFLTIRTVWIRLKIKPSNGFLKLLIALGLVIGIAAMFTHVLEHRPFRILMMFVLSFIALSGKMGISYGYFRGVTVLFATAVFSLCQYANEIINWDSYKKWERAKALSATGYVLESQKIYAYIFPDLKDDVGFLMDYNDALVSKVDYGRKLFLLKKLMESHTNNLSYQKLAAIYDEIGMEKEAEQAYLKAVYIVPNRFIPKGALLDFYDKSKQFEKSAYWRRAILAMPIKVPSERINAIRKKARDKSIYINTLTPTNYEN